MSAHQAKKRFGQNFLHDSGVIERIIRSINPQTGDSPIEIRPGLGPFTAPLLPKTRGAADSRRVWVTAMRKGGEGSALPRSRVAVLSGVGIGNAEQDARLRGVEFGFQNVVKDA